MTGKTISSTVTTTVTIGVGGYVSPLSITSQGEIDPSAYGAVGLLLNASSALATIVNSGVIEGGAGSGYAVDAAHGGNGGYAVDLLSAFRFTNNGVIEGGNGGGGDYSGGQGGTAVNISAAGTFTNSGQILGGNGGYGNPDAGAAGYAVVLNTKATLINSGTIRGGNAGLGEAAQYYGLSGGTAILAGRQDLIENTGLIAGGGSSPGGSGGYGGIGVDLLRGTLTNGGTIAGGAGGSTQYDPGGNGGDGVVSSGASSVTNTGVIRGGNGNHYGNYSGGNGGLGIYVGTYGTVTNSGTISGGAGASANAAPGSGGIGMDIGSYSTASNSGVIDGGAGGAALDYYGFGGEGGDGVVISQSSFSNTGSINGGASGYTPGFPYTASGDTNQAGGDGLYARSGVITNSGVITGGAGGDDLYNGGTAGTGGVGVSLADSTLTNTGTIVGGMGGIAPPSNYDNAYGGQGGAGALVAAGATLVNDALIKGGNGGQNFYYGAVGGNGVIIDGGVFTNAGTVKGGNGGFNGSGGMGDAVFFEAAGTLIAAPGAKFVGDVVSELGSGAVLELTGTSSTALTGIGSQFVGINLITFATGARRALAGSTGGFESTTIGGFAAHDTLVLDGFAAVPKDTYFEPSLNRILFENGAAGYAFVNMSDFLAKDLKVTESGGNTTLTGLGTSAVVLANGAAEFVRSGGTASATIDQGATEQIFNGGTAAITTIAGGSLVLEIGAKTSGSIAFSGTGGSLDIESGSMPTAEITGFVAGDGITLSGVVYNSNDTVKVITAGTVSIIAPGATYNLLIAGATVGETDFHFSSGSVLTRGSTPGELTFMRPPEDGQKVSASLVLPGLETLVHEQGQTGALISGTQSLPWASQQIVSAKPLFGVAGSPLLSPQNSFAAPVTLHGA